MTEQTKGTEDGSVERTVRLILYLSRSHGEITIKTLSRELHLSPSTVHRLVQRLVSLGIMQRLGATRTYELGLEMYRLGARMSSKANLVQLATSSLHRMVKRTNEGCALGIFRPDDLTVIFAAYVESPQPLRYRIELFNPVSILWGSSGRSILAFLDSKVASSLVRTRRRSPTGIAPAATGDLLKELDLIKARGFAVSRRGEKIEGAAGISAPIFDPSGHVIGCLSLTIPDSRYRSDREDALGRMLVLEARKTSILVSRIENNL